MRMQIPKRHGWFHSHTLEAVLLAIGLMVIVLMAAIFLAQRIRTAALEQARERPNAAPLSLEYGPNFNPGTGTVYDGKGYGTPAQSARPLSLEYGPNFNPGTGTVYDGKHR